MKFKIFITYLKNGCSSVYESEIVAQNMVDALEQAKMKAVQQFIYKNYVTDITISEIPGKC